MLVDSHCHLDFPELAGELDSVFALMRENRIECALCVSVTLDDFPRVRRLAETHAHIYGSVGVHPDYESAAVVSVAQLVELAAHPRIVAIGETGLDYFRLKGDLEWQRERFRTHIRAARECGKPLIVHTREAAADTLQIMREEGADKVGGVMHCFTESLEVAKAAMDLGFYISFSGIVTFKNAKMIKEVAAAVPLDRMLVETDAPYLAPAPFRGRTNQPGYVKHVAAEVARLKGLDYDQVCRETTSNFYQLFNSIIHDIKAK
jgi:TatD DNase family protein